MKRSNENDGFMIGAVFALTALAVYITLSAFVLKAMLE